MTVTTKQTDLALKVLKACCSSDDAYKYAMTSPFRIGAHVYATDGRIAFRTPLDIETTPGDKPPPAADTLNWERERFADDPTAFEAPTPVSKECGRCNGEGEVKNLDCLECDGLGETECYACGQDSDCHECGGTGNVQKDGPCEKCSGKGRIFERVRVPVGFTGFADHYLRIIAEHGGKLYLDAKGRADMPALFIIEGVGEGLLMPMRGED